MVNVQNANGLTVFHSRLQRMKMLAGRGLLFALVGFALAGCGHNELLQIERIMESDVQKADSMIQSMNEPAGKRNQALYALLKTQIDYKLYRTFESDSLIRIATDYYGYRHKSSHAAMAWYSLGCVSGELGDEVKAADSYHTALFLFPDTLVRYYALAQQNLGAIYLYHNLDEKAVPLLKSCRINSERLSDSVVMAFCDYNLALNMLYHKKYDEAKCAFDELKENRWLSPGIREGIMLQMTKISLYGNQDYQGTINYIDTLFQTDIVNSKNGHIYSIKADAFYELGLLDSAKQYYQLSIANTAEPKTLYSCYKKLTEIASIASDSLSRTYYASKANECMDSITAISKSNIIFNSLLNHSIQDRRKGIPLYLFLLVIFLFVGGYFAKRLYQKKKEKDNMNRIYNAQSISDFCDEIENFKQSNVYAEILAAISKNDSFKLHDRSVLIEKCHGNLLNVRSFLMSKYALNSQEVDFCFFILLGVSQKNCQLFFNYSDSGIRTLKYRVKSKLPQPEFDYLFVKK